MKFENTQVWGFEHALRGMRNPLESWEKSDTDWQHFYDKHRSEKYQLGENDLKLAQRLILSGSEHRKFLRQIFVSVDITAPLYWWKEFDTYKVGTVANSTSTMHKLATTPITLDCFEFMNVLPSDDKSLYNDWANQVINQLESLRQQYLQTKDKRYWRELVRWLPESWLQTRTVTMNYENVRTMIHQRNNHKLNEWSGIDNPYVQNFIGWTKTLPLADELLFLNEDDNE